MDFPSALKQVLYTDARITRTSWDKLGRYVFDHKTAKDLRITHGTQPDDPDAPPNSISYIPTHDDIRATDWEILPARSAEQSAEAAA